MYLIPLNQMESVELVIHALKAAAGEADCTSCPAHRVCMKQCLSIATGIERLFDEAGLPQLDLQEDGKVDSLAPSTAEDHPHLKRIK